MSGNKGYIIAKLTVNIGDCWRVRNAERAREDLEMKNYWRLVAVMSLSMTCIVVLMAIADRSKSPGGIVRRAVLAELMTGGLDCYDNLPIDLKYRSRWRRVGITERYNFTPHTTTKPYQSLLCRFTTRDGWVSEEIVGTQMWRRGR